MGGKGAGATRRDIRLTRLSDTLSDTFCLSEEIFELSMP